MGLRGRKGQTADENRRKGNTRKRNLEKEETTVEVSETQLLDLYTLVKPKDVLFPEAEEVWDDLIAKMSTLKILLATDAWAFADYCIEEGYALKWQRILNKKGEYRLDSSRKRVPREEVKWAREARKSAATLRACLGLTPANRKAMKVEVNEMKSQDASTQQKAHVLGQD